MSTTIQNRASVDRALQWVADNLDLFDPFREGQPFEILRCKSVGELALMLYCHVQLTGDRESDPVRRITELLLAVQANPRLRERIARYPADFPLTGEVYAALRAVGHDDAEQRTVLQRVIDLDLLAHMERPPHRVMDVRLTLEWGGFGHSWPGYDEMLPHSILARVPCPLYLDESAAYALTHVILFLYGFGTRADPPVPLGDVGRLQQALSMLLVIYAQERHWDLLGEVLLCWDCIGLAPSPVYGRAWDAFLATQKADGAFPGPVRRRKEPGKEEPPAGAAPERWANFSANYHTTLVAILAGTVHREAARRRALRPAARGEAVDEELAVPRSGGAEPVSRLDDECSRAVEHARAWLEKRLDAATQDSTAPAGAFCYLHFGGWLCDSGLRSPASAASLSASALQVCRALEARDAEAEGQGWAAPPALRLIVSALLDSRGLAVPPLREFMLGAAEALTANPAGDPLEDLLLCEKRVILHALGLHPQPVRLGYAEALALLRTFPLDGSRAAVEELLLRIESLTAYGTHTVSLAPDDLWVRELLAGLAMHFLRSYDLLTASRLLRSMVYLGIGRGEEFDACLRFLLLHQRPDGAFGFFGPEHAALEDAAPEGFSVELHVHLPVTIACLLTLIEASHGQQWRLYRSLPKPAAPADSIPIERLVSLDSPRTAAVRG